MMTIPKPGSWRKLNTASADSKPTPQVAVASEKKTKKFVRPDHLTNRPLRDNEQLKDLRDKLNQK